MVSEAGEKTKMDLYIEKEVMSKKPVSTLKEYSFRREVWKEIVIKLTSFVNLLCPFL